METVKVVYIFKNLKTGQYVKDCWFYQGKDNCGHIALNFTDKKSEAFELKSLPFEPNQTRFAEMLTSLTDAIYKAVGTRTINE